jgi:hypothetical protein
VQELAAALEPFGFAAVSNDNQGRFVSSGDRYPERFRLIPTRGWRRPGHVRVNRKGRRSQDMIEQNARLIDHQPPLPEMPAGRVIGEEPARNVWVAYEFTAELLSIHLVFGSQLRDGGRILNWAELETIARELPLVPEPRVDLPEAVEPEFEPLEEKEAGNS